MLSFTNKIQLAKVNIPQSGVNVIACGAIETTPHNLFSVQSEILCYPCDGIWNTALK